MENAKFVTSSFGTEVGYFVRDGKKLVHVFGIHYDFAPRTLAHPAFHAQLESLIGGRSHKDPEDSSRSDCANGRLLGFPTGLRGSVASLQIYCRRAGGD